MVIAPFVPIASGICPALEILEKIYLNQMVIEGYKKFRKFQTSKSSLDAR